MLMMRFLTLCLAVFAAFPFFWPIPLCGQQNEPTQHLLTPREKTRQELKQMAEPLENLSKVIQQATVLTAPSIVQIKSKQQRHETRGDIRRLDSVEIVATGCGFIVEIDSKRVILTNRHVVESLDLADIHVLTHDRRFLKPTRIHTNADFDLAIVEIDAASQQEMQPIQWGESDQVHVGQIILAIGNPFDLNRSVSMGIVSAVNRREIPAASGPTPIVGFFQIDAAVNPGSSGGPLINLRGEVLGMITAIATHDGGNVGVAFVMPGKIIKKVAEQLVRDGVVTKPFIGLGFEAHFDEQEHQNLGLDRMIGAKINHVAPDSPAFLAGIQPGDVLLQLAQTEMENDRHVVDFVAQSETGQTLTFLVLRNGERREGKVTLSQKPSH